MHVQINCKYSEVLDYVYTCTPTLYTETLKQTRIIQFSLLSTEILDTGWMVRPQSKTKHCTARKKKVQQKLDRKKRANVLTLGILKRLRNVSLKKNYL